MKTFFAKLKYIGTRYLYIALAISLILFIIRWLTTVQFSLVDVREEVWEWWLPILLPLAALIIWLRPKFAILTFKNDNGSFALFLIASTGLLASTILQQHYFTTATGKLLTLQNADEISANEQSRYYTFNDYWIERSYGGAYDDFRTTGKNNDFLDITVYFVYPLLRDSSQHISETPQRWFGINFKKTINAKLPETEIDSFYNTFYNECLESLDDVSIYDAVYFERVPKSNEKENYLEAITARIKKPADNSYVILEARNEAFELRNGDYLAWALFAFCIGQLFFALVLIWPSYDEAEHQRLQKGGKPLPGDAEALLDYLIPQDDHFATSILLDLNLLVYIAMVLFGVHFLNPTSEDLLAWGANLGSLTTDGQWWRLLTNTFLHSGLMHLVLNIYALVIAGIYLEPVLGRKNYFIVYLAAGLCGSIASIWWYEDTISVGASGAIFGLFGAILSLLLTDAYPKSDRKSILIFLGIYVGISLLWGLTDGIDNAAHVGGLATGALVGYLLFKLQKQKVL